MFVHTPFLEEHIPDTPCNICQDGLCSKCNGEKKAKDYNGNIKDCWVCSKEKPGKCYNCHGTGKYTKKVFEKKDWGQVLADLMQDPTEEKVYEPQGDPE